jgi:hypothetical protein
MPANNPSTKPLKPHEETVGWRRISASMPRTIPKGRVLAHNHIMHTAWMPNGLNGFPCWTMPEDNIHKSFVPCPCGWSGLPHYAHRDHVAAVRKLKSADKCWTAGECGLPGVS